MVSQHRQSQPGPHDPVHHEPAGDVFQLFRDILAQHLQRAAAGGTYRARREDRLVALQMIRQRLTAVPTAGIGGGRGRLRRGGGLGDGRVLGKAQAKLVQVLRRGSEALPLVPRQLVLQLLDDPRLGLNLARQKTHQFLQTVGVVGQGVKRVEHVRTIADPDPQENPE